MIRNQKEFESFEWPDPEEVDYELLSQLSKDLPKGMKLIPYSPDGVLENVIRLMGFTELGCFLCFDLSVLSVIILSQHANEWKLRKIVRDLSQAQKRDSYLFE